MLPVALSVGLLDAGYGTAGVGYALGAWMAALALCMLFGGVLADRFTPRRMMVLADLARLAFQSAMALMFLTGHTSLWAIVLLQALSGAATALVPARRGQHGPPGLDRRPARQRGAAHRRIERRRLGPALAGVLVGFSGAGVVFVIYAATYAVSAGCLFGLRLATAEPAGGDSFLRQLATGWNEFRARPGCGGSSPPSSSTDASWPGSPCRSARTWSSVNSAPGLGIGMAALGAGGVSAGCWPSRSAPPGPWPSAPSAGPCSPCSPSSRRCARASSCSASSGGWPDRPRPVVRHLGHHGADPDPRRTPEPRLRLRRGRVPRLDGPRPLPGRSASPSPAKRPLMVFATLLGLLCSALLLVLPATRNLRAIPR